MTFLLLIFSFFYNPGSSTIQLYLYDKTHRVYSVEAIDSVVCKSATRIFVFPKPIKSSNSNYLILHDLPIETYEITVYRFYYADKIVKNVALKDRFTKVTAEFDEAEKLEPSKATYPDRGKSDFMCLIKRDLDPFLEAHKGYAFAGICFTIDTLGNATAYAYDQKPNIVVDEVNRIIKTNITERWNPSTLKGKKFSYTFCCSACTCFY